MSPRVRFGAMAMTLLLCACSGSSGVPREPVVDTPLALPVFAFTSKAADVDGDGLPDVLLFIRDSRAPGFESVVALLSTGDGSFRATPSAAGLFGAVVADVDGDGRADLVSTCANVARTIVVALGNGDGTFRAQAPIAVPAGDCNDPVVAGDFNGDGRIDLLRLSFRSDATLLTGLGNGQFIASSVPATTPDPGSSIPSAIAASLTGDGRDDVVLIRANFSLASGVVEAYASEGNAFRRTGVTQAPGTAIGIAVGDTDADGRLDLVALNEDRPPPPAVPGPDRHPTLHRFPGKGDGTFGTETWARRSSDLRAFVVGDADNDGLADIVVLERVPGSSDEEVRILTGTRNGDFAEPASPRFRGPPLGAVFIGLHVADFDGDGKRDVALVYTSGVRLLRGQ